MRTFAVPEFVRAHPACSSVPEHLPHVFQVLSRAFRNRFLELHIDDIPGAELEDILRERCALAPPFCKKLVLIMKELQLHRQRSGVFLGKHGFITTRDLLRWANRNPTT